MLQNLLADRFTLRTHREMRDMQMCRLLRSAGGPKLKAHVEEAVVETKPGNRPPGFYYKAKAKTVTDFAKVLEGQLGKPVVDATGLAGTYDFDVWWGFNDLDADGRSPTESPTMLTAIRTEPRRREPRLLHDGTMLAVYSGTRAESCSNGSGNERKREEPR
jgi:uncharacterized protein (TIGR03435 family)